MLKLIGRGSFGSSCNRTPETIRFFIYSLSFSLFLFHSRSLNSYFRDSQQRQTSLRPWQVLMFSSSQLKRESALARLPSSSSHLILVSIMRKQSSLTRLSSRWRLLQSSSICFTFSRFSCSWVLLVETQQQMQQTLCLLASSSVKSLGDCSKICLRRALHLPYFRKSFMRRFISIRKRQILILTAGELLWIFTLRESSLASSTSFCTASSLSRWQYSFSLAISSLRMHMRYETSTLVVSCRISISFFSCFRQTDSWSLWQDGSSWPGIILAMQRMNLRCSCRRVSSSCSTSPLGTCTISTTISLFYKSTSSSLNGRSMFRKTRLEPSSKQYPLQSMKSALLGFFFNLSKLFLPGSVSQTKNVAKQTYWNPPALSRASSWALMEILVQACISGQLLQAQQVLRLLQMSKKGSLTRAKLKVSLTFAIISAGP